MHSVFWTLAKSTNQALAAREQREWNDGRAIKVPTPRTKPVAVDNSYNAFLQESTIDEIAFMGGADPLDLRRRLMSAHPVALALIDKVAAMSGWATPLPQGRARGFAFTLAFGTWVAEVVEVSQQDAGIRIERVFCAADPGIVFDVRNFKARMMTGILQGLSAAIGERAASSDGRQATVYRAPEIEIEVLVSSGQMSGAGEAATPRVMPALANAVFALTGKRLRRLPLGDEVAFV